MLQVNCKDVSGNGCEFVAEGKKDRHVKARMIDHLRTAHPELVSGIDYEQLQEIEGRIKAGTRSASLA